jgi:hypothetical protein
LGVYWLDDDGRRRSWVGRKPGWEWSPFLGVVAPQHAADVGVVFGIAVVFRGEEILLEGGDAVGGCVEERPQVGRHCGVPPVVDGGDLGV